MAVADGGVGAAGGFAVVVHSRSLTLIACSGHSHISFTISTLLHLVEQMLLVPRLIYLCSAKFGHAVSHEQVVGVRRNAILCLFPSHRLDDLADLIIEVQNLAGFLYGHVLLVQTGLGQLFIRIVSVTVEGSGSDFL